MKHTIPRIRFLMSCVVVVALILASKLYIVQVVDGSVYSEKADRQYVKPNQTVFDRGTIFFETKDGTLLSAATVKEGFTLVMNPKLLTDPEGAYNAIRELLPIEKESFMQKAAKTDDPYEEIMKKVDKNVGFILDDMKIPGIRAYKENWRVYPGEKLAAHAVGLMGYKDDEYAGRYGLERYYENILRRGANSTYVNFFAEIFADIQNKILKGKELEGDVVATIEPTVQNFLEKKLSEVHAHWQPDSAGGIIMNPKTGEIYAMSALPNFNPNNLKDVEDPRIFSNPLVENVYEMGSIVKALTMAAGLDSGAVTPESTYNDEGFLTLNGKRIANYDGKARGVVSMQQVLSQSLNTGAAYVALKIGNEKFRQYLYNFGIGELTGIDQPNEQKGIIENLKSPREIEMATASYGQGIAMSPIVTVRALSALGNGGKLVKPHLVKRIDYKVGVSKVIEPESVRQVISKNASEEITRMLVEVVDKALKNGDIKMEHYSIAAKTGTAQIADSENGGYYGDRYLHSFFGYFPAYDPKFLVFLYQVYPKGAQYASETLTMPFSDLAKFLINYYEIPPDR
jgi:stage V sporulation protein D (sporulation-specific penicillin-binding protein)